MKKLISRTIALLFLITLNMVTFAQHPPHPSNGTGPGSSNNPVGGGAPLESGWTLLLVLAAAYGTKKLYRVRKKLIE